MNDRTYRFSPFSAMLAEFLRRSELRQGARWISKNSAIDRDIKLGFPRGQISETADFNKYTEHRYLWKVRAVYGNFDVWLFSRSPQSGLSYLRWTEVVSNCIEFWGVEGIRTGDTRGGERDVKRMVEKGRGRDRE